MPHPARGLKCSANPVSIIFLPPIIVSQYRHIVGLRRTFHIIHLFETRVADPDPDWIRIQSGQWIRSGFGSRRAKMTLKSRKNLVKFMFWSVGWPSDIWSVDKEPNTIAIFEFTTWHASFTYFFIKLRHYTAIGKQLLISNVKNRVR